MQNRILIVDDEPDILEILRFNLEMEGYEVETAESADEADEIVNCQLANGNSIDLILLDVMMTPKSGFQWAIELKSRPSTANIPIIFCTAKTMEQDIVHGFALGSDDYICKPFRISEVKARISAVLRRTANIVAEDSTNTVRYKGIIMNMDTKDCVIDGSNVVFTKLEFELLALLIGHPRQVFSREKILRIVWPDDTIVLDRTVDVNITRIRKKIGNYGKLIRTRFGYGYYFDA